MTVRGPGGAALRRWRSCLARLLVVVTAAGAFGIGCRRSEKIVSPPAPVLTSVELEDVSAGTPGAEGGTVKYDTAALGSLVRRALVTGGLVTPPETSDAATPAKRASTRIRGRVGIEVVEVEGKGVVRAVVALALISRPSDAAGALNEELSAASEQPYEVAPSIDRHALGQRLLERTTGDLVNGYVARIGLTTAPPERVHAAIVGDAGVLREEAIRIAGARGLKDEVPALLPLLQNDNERLRDAALGALIAMRERRAVAQLTRNRSMRDRHEMRKILEAIAILGGDEARDYLSFVADSHDDEEIRKLAAEAKARMERHAPPSGEPSQPGHLPGR